jgi:pimeloyl-ACP methyl ester carboxylesterase
MRKGKLRVAGMLPIAAMVLGVGVGPTASAGTSAIRWAPCTEDSTAECGTLSLPVDWANPRGPRFDLSLARRRAADPATRIGTVIDMPGGPGDSGVDSVLADRSAFIRRTNRRFDVVSYDPRGIGRSHRVRCSAELLAAQPPPIPAGQRDFDARVAYNRALRADCRARTGPLLDHVDTLSGVRDLDAVRAALGEATLTFRGRSYGTLLGEQYAERYPARVRALALDSVVDHSVGTRELFETGVVATQDAFDQFVAWCGRTAECALHGRDVRAVWAHLLARAERGDLRNPDDPQVALRPFSLIDQAEQALRAPNWPELAEGMVALAATDPAPAAPAAPVVTDYAPVAVTCSDYHLPVRDYRAYASLLRDSARIAPDMRYSTFAVIATTTCLGAPQPVNNPQHPLRVRDSATPLLLVNSLHDPATGYIGAVNVAGQLGTEGVLLTYRGWGHIVDGRTDCVDDAVDRYLATLALPARGGDCPAAPPESG